MEEEIINHLGQQNFNIRATGDARFMDQKVTPDVLCIIADCVLNFTEANHDIEFTTKDIWENEYANTNVKDIFNKPDVLTKTAKSEYDKFFQQPLKMMSYSKILTCEKRGVKNIFKVSNRPLLKYISIKERNALTFLVQYLEKVLKDSDIWSMFNNFFDNNDKVHFNALKTAYEEFIIRNTPINGKTEVRRIFTKVINPLSYIRKLRGTKGGSFSTDIIGYDELMYNRRNWRDVTKLRGETRQAYEDRAKNEIQKSKAAFIALTKEKIRRYHIQISELHDYLSNGLATQVHHIFPQTEFPQLAAILENLILLTPTQHLSKAHPANNTRLIDRDYQLACLLAKSDSIQLSITNNDGFYAKEDFVFVLNEGVAPQVKFNNENSFPEIEEKITDEYNQNT